MTQKIISAFAADRRLWTTFLATAAPWILLLVFFSGWPVGMHFVVFVLALWGGGYGLVNISSLNLRHEEYLFLPISVGYIIFGATISVLVKGGVSPEVSTLAPVALSVYGYLSLSSNVRHLKNSKVSNGYAIASLSSVICAIYFTPSVLSDAVHTESGGYKWMYVDTQYFMAIAASVKSGFSSVNMPGMYVGEQNYHFGAYALAGGWSALTGIDLGDSIARVSRGTGQLALLLSTIGLGNTIGRKWGAPRIGGLLGSAGFFLYGSVGALFAVSSNSSSLIERALIVEIPYMNIPVSNGGAFSHLLLGHSVMHGMIGLTSVVGIFLLWGYRNKYSLSRARLYLLSLVPALVIPINSVAGLGSVGISVLLVIMYGKKPRSIYFSSLALIFGYLMFYWMGYTGGRSEKIVLDWYMQDERIFSVFTWLFVGLGVRVIALDKVRKWTGDPASTVVAASTAGFALFTLLLDGQHWGSDRYGFAFLQCILSIFAFVLVASFVEKMFFGEGPKESIYDAFFRVLRWSGFLFIFAAIVGLLSGWSTWSTVDKVIYGSVVIVSASTLYKFRSEVHSTYISPLKYGVLSLVVVGFLAWIPSLADFGADRLDLRVRLTGAETTALKKIRNQSSRTDVIATNKHVVPSIPSKSERSYAYRALSERPILLEGWRYDEQFHPSFGKVSRKNEKIFQSENIGEVKKIVEEYNVSFVLCKPKTDIKVETKNAKWIDKLKDLEGVNAYKVVQN